MLSETLTERHHPTPQNGEAFDLIIIGSGPAGMSAALCASRAKLKTLIIEKTLPGGQVSTAYKIKNYLGFPNGILGDRLGFQMEHHLEEYPIYHCRETAEDIFQIQDHEKTVRTDVGNVYKTRAVIIAVGLDPKQLHAEFERKFIGRGVSYYAQGDVESYAGKDVAVIGGGNCACYAADYLADTVNHLYLIHRSDRLKAVATLKEKVMNNPKITILWHSEVIDALGLDKVEKIKCRNVITTQSTWLDVKGIFVYVGRIPPKHILHLDVALDEKGYILTDETMRTNVKGIYAAGDIRSKQVRQVATAVADGMIAAINVERDLLN